MEFKNITYQPGKVARIIFDRPQYLNAQDYGLLAEVDQAFGLAVADKNCGAIVLSGAGRAFSAGHDLGTPEHDAYCEKHGMAGSKSLDLAQKVKDMLEFYVQKTLAWRNCEKPTIAMVHGYCIYAGWMLAAAMDVIFAEKETLFLPGMVEYFSAPWDLGPRKTKEILFEHRFITAAEAMEYGFVNRIYTTDQLEEETLAYAGRVADNYLSAPAWTGNIKNAINHMQDVQGFSSEIEAAYNTFCLMYGLGAHSGAGPDQGGFARTNIAKKNFEHAKPWLESIGLYKKSPPDKK
jgi:enoyl-CoA hydratase